MGEQFINLINNLSTQQIKLSEKDKEFKKQD